MTLDNNSLLIVIGIIAIIAELLLGVATGFDLLLLGVIFVVSGIVGLVTGVFAIALILVAGLSLLYIFIGRGYVKSKLSIRTHATNIDAIIGKKGIVVKTISSQKPGQVKVNGETWRAEIASDATEAEQRIDEGKEVRVDSVSGVTLRVSV